MCFAYKINVHHQSHFQRFDVLGHKIVPYSVADKPRVRVQNDAGYGELDEDKESDNRNGTERESFEDRYA